MDAKIPVNNLLSTRGRQVVFLIAWEFEVEEGRGIPGELPSLFPRSPESPLPRHALFSFESLSRACCFKDNRQIGFHKHYQRTPKTTVKQKCETK